MSVSCSDRGVNGRAVEMVLFQIRNLNGLEGSSGKRDNISALKNSKKDLSQRKVGDLGTLWQISDE